MSLFFSRLSPAFRTVLCSKKFFSSEAPSAAAPTVILEMAPNHQGVAIVSLNRPEALNAMNMELLKELADTFKKLREDSTVRAIVLTGKGKAFSAGIDLVTAQKIFQGKPMIGSEQDPLTQMNLVNVPIIGAINGHAITGGFELALNCDFLIGSPDAKFMDTHAKFGIHPAWGLSQILPRLIGAKRALEVSLTALPVDANTAEKWGLLNRVVPAEQLLPTAIALAGAISSNVPELVLRYRRAILDGQNMGLADARKMEAKNGLEYYKTMTPETFKKMQAFIQGRSKK